MNLSFEKMWLIPANVERFCLHQSVHDGSGAHSDPGYDGESEADHLTSTQRQDSSTILQCLHGVQKDITLLYCTVL